MKIVLISYYCRYSEFPTYYSLGTLRLASAISSLKNCTVSILPIDSDNFNISSIDISQIRTADIVGFPMFEWTKEHSKKLAKYVEGITLLGGPSIYNLRSDEWPSETIIIRGEGEEALQIICNNFLQGKCTLENLKEVKEGKFFGTNEKFEFIKESEELYEGECLYSSENLTKLGIKRISDEFCWFETMRGCNYNCSFCGHNVRKSMAFFSMEKVKDEVKSIGNIGFKETFIIDPELGGNRKRGKEILKFFQQYAPQCKIIMYLRAEFLDDEYIAILKKSNIKEIRIGIQTLNENVEKHVRNNSIYHITKYLPMLIHNDITWMGELIVGLPGDDIYGLRETLRKLFNEIKPTIVSAYHLSLIPGTRLYDYVIENEAEGDNNKWIRKDQVGRSFESYSYSHKELNYMLIYSGIMTLLYNKTKMNFEKCEEKILPIISKLNFADDRCRELDINDMLMSADI